MASTWCGSCLCAEPAAHRACRRDPVFDEEDCLYRDTNLVVTELHAIKGICGPGDAAGGHELDLVSALPAFLVYGAPYLINTIGDAGEARGATMVACTTARLVVGIPATRIEVAAGLRDEPSCVQQSRTGRQPRLKGRRKATVCASRVADSRKATVQHLCKGLETERSSIRVAPLCGLSEVEVRQPHIDVCTD
jgi:hypothetical protein